MRRRGEASPHIRRQSRKTNSSASVHPAALPVNELFSLRTSGGKAAKRTLQPPHFRRQSR